MKKIRTLMLTALALIMGAMTAFASPENPTNEEVMTALTRATTVFEWFEHNPLPTDGKERFDSATCSIIPYRTRPFTTCWI